jgi:hypothetical protein
VAIPRISFAASLATTDHEPADPRQPPRVPPAERSFWELLPRRNFRRALFLLAALVAILVIKRMGGFSFARMFDSVAPAPAPASAPAPKAEPSFQHLEVKR